MRLQTAVAWIANRSLGVTLVLALFLTWSCGSQEKQLAFQTVAAQLPATAPPAASGQTRVERDLLGEKAVPASAYYGIQTERALENFQISGVPINRYPEFIQAWAIVKLAAAQANTDVGAMKKEKLDAIEKASQEVLRGDYNNQFLVDWYQGGAGTSTNMNANEVIANVALELTNHKKGAPDPWRRSPPYLTDNVRLELEYGLGRLDRFNLQGYSQFFQARIQLQL